jgi:hypothetical protein
MTRSLTGGAPYGRLEPANPTDGGLGGADRPPAGQPGRARDGFAGTTLQPDVNTDGGTMKRSTRQPVILMAVLAILAALLWASPAQASTAKVRPAIPANCAGYTSGPYSQNPTSLVGFATTTCWNEGTFPDTTYARGTMWRAPTANGPWSGIASAEGWGGFFGTDAVARVEGGGTCGWWYLMTGFHNKGSFGGGWTSRGTPTFWPCG